MTLKEFMQEFAKTPEYFGKEWSKKFDRLLRISDEKGQSYCPITAVYKMLKNPKETPSVSHYTTVGIELGLSLSRTEEIAASADFTPSVDWFDQTLREELLTTVGVEYDTI